MFSKSQIKIIWNISNILLIIIIFFIIVSVLLRIILMLGSQSDKYKPNLQNDGVIIIPNFISDVEIQNIKTNINNNEINKAKQYIINSNNIQTKIAQLFGNDYEFHDYIFLIKKSQFHTCHRDYNGNFFNEGQQFPSYTIIIYLEDMHACLDVIPKSHKSKDAYNYNLTDYTKTLYCNHGDAILFDANLIHNGSLNYNENSMRIQMKISNKADRKVLDFYNNYNKMLNAENNTPMAIKQIQKHVSCQFPAISYFIKQYDFNKNKTVSADVDKLSIFANIFSSAFTELENVA
jgi:hypothetical protein